MHLPHVQSCTWSLIGNHPIWIIFSDTLESHPCRRGPWFQHASKPLPESTALRSSSETNWEARVCNSRFKAITIRSHDVDIHSLPMSKAVIIQPHLKGRISSKLGPLMIYQFDLIQWVATCGRHGGIKMIWSMLYSESLVRGGCINLIFALDYRQWDVWICLGIPQSNKIRFRRPYWQYHPDFCLSINPKLS